MNLLNLFEKGVWGLNTILGEILLDEGTGTAWPKTIGIKEKKRSINIKIPLYHQNLLSKSTLKCKHGKVRFNL